MGVDPLRDREESEESYTSDSEYISKNRTRAEIADKWSGRIEAANRVYKAWATRFKVATLYQYYEGFQFLLEQDENNRPYVVNLIYSTIETKLPNLLFSNPQFTLRPRPTGDNFNLDQAAPTTQVKEDALNFVCQMEEFNLTDKQELAVLDAFFGFGILECDYSEDPSMNPYINRGDKNPLNNLYCKQIPFDHFRVSAAANWDLSKGKWWGYFEDVPFADVEKYIKQGRIIDPPSENLVDEDILSSTITTSGQIVIGEPNEDLVPNGYIRLWRLWDFAEGKRIVLNLDRATLGNRLLEYEDFKTCPISVLRFGKRRKGWYPLPPVFNWISPQDEINEIRQTQRIHRKRFSRKYLIRPGAFDSEEEVEKLMYGPDGTFAKVQSLDAIKPVEDSPLDAANNQSLMVSYDDMNRVSGTSDEQRNIADRQTATQSTIINQRAQIRESKDLVRIANFMNSIGRNVLRALGKAKRPFWVLAQIAQEAVLSELKTVTKSWKKIPPGLFRTDDYSIDLKPSSVSPISQQEDKRDFLEFLAVLTQYEILSMSPALLREAAYRCGYRNETVLKQFQQLAQLAAIGRLVQAKQAAGAIPQGPVPTQPGTLPQQQVDTSTPPDNQSIMNMIFNKQGVQQPQ